MAEKSMTRAGAAIAALCVTAPAVAQTTAPYLYDVLKQPAYRAAWNKLIAGAKVPAWLMRFSKTYDGVVTPAKTADVEGLAYQLFWVCKPHDCGGNEFEVMFSPGAATAKGALIDNAAAPRFFGAPDAAQAAALMQALKEE